MCTLSLSMLYRIKGFSKRIKQVLWQLLLPLCLSNIEFIIPSLYIPSVSCQLTTMVSFYCDYVTV